MMTIYKLLPFFSLMLAAGSSWGLTSNNLAYGFGFDRGDKPSLCTYGSSNAPLLNASSLNYNPANVIWNAVGGVGDTGYIRTKPVQSDSLNFFSASGLPMNCTDFSVSFNVRNYSGKGNAVLSVNGATVNNTWSIWGVGGGSSSWKDAAGNADTAAPELNKTSAWQSVIYAIKGKTATVFIDGKNRGTFTFVNNFAGSPKLTSVGFGTSGTSANTTVEADVDNLILWNKAVTTEEEAMKVAAAKSPSEIPGEAGKQAGKIVRRVWNYNDLGNSYFTQQNTDGSTGTNPNPKIRFEDGQLKITVRAGSGDRRKLRTDLPATTGRYKWRLCLPERDGNSNMSVGAFIYYNDQCEIDFEIAAGKASERTKYKAKNDELLAYMTNQAFPYHSTAVPIKPGWHTVEIDVSDKNGKIFLRWFIDGKQVKTLDTTLSSSSRFSVISSVENLGFAGGHPPSKQTTVSFDRAEYYYHP